MTAKGELAKRIIELEREIEDRDRQLSQIAAAECSVSQIEEEIRRRVEDRLAGKPHLSQGPGFDYWVGVCGHEWRLKDSKDCPYCRVAKLEQELKGVKR